MKTYIGKRLQSTFIEDTCRGWCNRSQESKDYINSVVGVASVLGEELVIVL